MTDSDDLDKHLEQYIFDLENTRKPTGPALVDDEDQLSIGSVINNDYEILEKISTTGFSYVYKAFSRSRNTAVAIKQYLHDGSLQGYLRERFAHSRFPKEQHPNITQALDFFTDRGRKLGVFSY